LSGQFNVASQYSNVSADHRGSLDLCISADHANIATDLGVPRQINVTAYNHKVAADPPLQSQVVAYNKQIACNELVFTDPYIAAEHGYIALHGPDSDFAPRLPGLRDQKYKYPKRDDEYERCPASSSS